MTFFYIMTNTEEVIFEYPHEMSGRSNVKRVIYVALRALMVGHESHFFF